MSFVGKRLLAAREARGLTQAQLAAKTGIAREDISNFENNKTSVGPKRLRVLAKALRISVVELDPTEKLDPPGTVLQDKVAKLEGEVGDLREALRLARKVSADLRVRVEALEVSPATRQARATRRGPEPK